MLLKDLCKYLNKKAPANLYAMDHDKVGLFVGDLDKDIKKVLTVTDASSDAIDYASENNIDMILCHHPFMFNPLGRIVSGSKIDRNDFAPIKNVCEDYFMENKLYKLIKNDIAVFSMHTNLDSVPGGLNDIFCEFLGLKNIVPIETKKIKYYMLTGTSLPEHKDMILKALFDAGAGSKNNYKDVYYEQPVSGNFTPMENANPLIGNINCPQSVNEVCFSVLVSETDLKKVTETYMKVHPYDVPIYYISESPECDYLPSIGRVGDLEKPMICDEFTQHCLKAFELPYAKCPFNCNRDKVIKRVGICSGSGGNLMDKAKDLGADAFCCGDIKHDFYLRATDLNMFALDLGHYETECTSSIVLGNYVNDIDNSIKTINFEVVRDNKLVKRMLGEKK